MNYDTLVAQLLDKASDPREVLAGAGMDRLLIRSEDYERLKRHPRVKPNLLATLRTYRGSETDLVANILNIQAVIVV
jgi:hypothetical protein